MTTDIGHHNSHLDTSIQRVIQGGTYKDCSTIALTPSRGEPGVLNSKWTIKFAVSLSNLIKPMNQKFAHWPVIGHEVAQAYNAGVSSIITDPSLSTWKYILTIEDDNLAPPDGFLKLLEAMEAHPEFSAIGGLYWTKGEGGQPMIYGDPREMPKSFRPQPPIPNAVQECNGLGMGFTLFRLAMFQHVPTPWFRTIQDWSPTIGTRLYTQDLAFFEEAAKHGFRFACHTGVQVGHYSEADGVIW